MRQLRGLLERREATNREERKVESPVILSKIEMPKHLRIARRTLRSYRNPQLPEGNHRLLKTQEKFLKPRSLKKRHPQSKPLIAK
jgi:hypothetical protein